MYFVVFTGIPVHLVRSVCFVARTAAPTSCVPRNQSVVYVVPSKTLVSRVHL